MRIGVVSDTHDNLRNVGRIVDLLVGAGVERVVHTGDITRAATLVEVARVGVPIFGVYGNNDDPPTLAATAGRLGISLVEAPLELHWHGRRILVVHDPYDLDGALADHHEVVLHGHTHRRTVERSATRVIFNPGECAGVLPGRNAVGLVDLETLATEVLSF